MTRLLRTAALCGLCLAVALILLAMPASADTSNAVVMHAAYQTSTGQGSSSSSSTPPEKSSTVPDRSSAADKSPDSQAGAPGANPVKTNPGNTAAPDQNTANNPNNPQNAGTNAATTSGGGSKAGLWGLLGLFGLLGLGGRRAEAVRREERDIRRVA